MEHNLLTGKLVRLTARDPEKDSKTVANWDKDSNYTRLLEGDPVTPPNYKAWRERFESMPDGSRFPFAVRPLDSDEMIGFVVLLRVEHTHANAYVGIGMGDVTNRGKGYGSEAMNLILRFAFDELNLHRVSLEAIATNAQAVRSYEKVGFVHEGRTRSADFRDGIRTDLVSMGILRSEWETKQTTGQNA